jgi:transposase
MPYIIGTDRNQTVFFPEILNEYINKDNPVRVFDAFVDSLDMETLGFSRHVPAEEGRPGYDPRDMLKLYIYGYFNKMRSSRLLMKEAERNVEVMWLINKLNPDFRTISDFRKEHVKTLKKVFKEFNKLCVEMELYSTEYISVDGSKFKAVNSKDRNFTLNKLDDRLERLDNQIDDYMHLLEKTDANEKDERSFSKEEIEEKIKTLNERKKLYTGYRDTMEQSGDSQLSLTDRESKLMKMNEGYGVGYNVQTAVDSKNYLIAGFDVTSNPTDHGLLEGVAAGVKEDFNLETIEAVADKGYRAGEDLLNCLFNGIIPNVPPTKGKTEIELETIHAAAEITDEMKNSKKAEDIKTCIQSGVIPEIYKDVISEIEIVNQTYYESPEEEANDAAEVKPMSEEEMIGKAKEGYFIRDIKKGRVYCPEGEILRQKSEKKDGSIRYYNKFACAGCVNKCTKSKYKEIDFPVGKLKIECRSIEKPKTNAEDKTVKKSKRTKKTREVVRFKLKPDRRKLDNRKCMSEHPFGTIKRALNGCYFLLKGRKKTNGEMALLCMAYNIKRAINIRGVRSIMKVLTEKAA